MYEGGEDVDLVLVLMGEVVEEVEEVEGKDSRVAIEFNTGSVSVESKSSTAVPSKLLGLDAWQTASRRTAAATLTRFRFMVNKLVLHKGNFSDPQFSLLFTYSRCSEKVIVMQIQVTREKG